MYKKIFTLLGAIIIIIAASSAINLISKNKEPNSSLPHYKQAFVKLKGSANFFANSKNKLTLLFVDEKKYSEFSKDYIKDIYVIDDQNNKYHFNNWSIQLGESKKNTL